MSNEARSMAALAAIVLVMALPGSAMAYIGPGAGITMLGALWAVFLAVGVALLGVIMLPVRMILRKRRRQAALKAEQEKDISENPAGDE